MTELQKGIITLIRSALDGTPRDLPEGFTMTDALPVIKKHQIITMAYEGAALCGISPAVPEMQELFKLYCQCLLKSERQMQAVESVCAAFDANKVEYLPLKGVNLKKLYPKPEMRLMGDADILIRAEKHEEISPIMEKLGFTFRTESDHEFVWNSPLLFLELHKRLIPSYNEDYYRYFGDGWKLAKEEKGSRYKLSREDEFIFVFCHFAKHYRDGGIGLRHVTDLWVYQKAYPEMNKAYVSAELKKLQLLDFYKNMQALLAVWFGEAKADEKTEFLAEYIFASGTWGKMESHIVSMALRAAKEHGGAKNAGRLRLLRMIFLPYKHMCKHYPVLEKCPALLPLFWPVRWVTAVLFRRKNIKVQQHQLEVSTAENVEAYETALNFVGLDFNFKE